MTYEGPDPDPTFTTLPSDLRQGPNASMTLFGPYLEEKKNNLEEKKT